jgi:hypothetical protein
MEITSEIKAKVFAQYLGQLALTNKESYKDPAPGNLSSVDISTGELITDGEGGYYLSEVTNTKLILKPLSQISDENAISCGHIARLKGDIKIDRFALGLTMTDENGRSLTIYFNHASNVRVKDEVRQAEVIEYSYLVYQNCVMLGYDMPHVLLGGKNLFECNLAIYG